MFYDLPKKTKHSDQPYYPCSNRLIYYQSLTEKVSSPSEIRKISEQPFHCQSQIGSVPERGKGLSTIQHLQNGKEILMFVHEHNKVHTGNTMSYVILGPCEYVDHKCARPMNIQWFLNEPIPAYLLNERRKLAVGRRIL
jgi:hypothetical protein